MHTTTPRKLRRRTRYRLQAIIALLSGILVVVTCVEASRNLFHWWIAYRQARETIAINRQVDFILEAGQNLAFERGRTSILLIASEPAAAESLQFIAERRRAVSENMEAVLSIGGLSRFPEAALIRKEYGELLVLRAKADALLGLPQEKRDPDFALVWFRHAARMIDDLRQLAWDLSLENGNFSASFRSYSRMKVLSLELRNYLGVESSRIAENIYRGNPVNPRELEVIMRMRGRSEAVRDMLSRENQLLGNPNLAPGFEMVNAAFFQSFRPQEDMVLECFRTGSPSPYSLSAYTTASIPALNSIASLMALLTRETAMDVARFLSDMRLQFICSLAMAVLAFMAGIAVVVVVVTRLFIPLRILGGQLERLAAGEVSGEFAPVGRDDEMTRGHALVLAFRDSLVQRKHLEDRLLNLSNRDGLTSLANRRCLDETLLAEWQRAIRSDEPLALVMFDVDLFKKFNDQYGHLAGDDCLRRVAAVISSHARRPGDLAARFGGEEFVAVLPGLSLAQATEWAESVRCGVEALGVEHGGVPEGRLTISAGVVSVKPERNSSPSDALSLADGALYRAKADGRNRVVTGA